jgi:hypothetical protein
MTDTTKAPGRIALIPSDGWSWTTWPIAHQEDAIEYIRKDVSDALIAAEWEEALREAVAALHTDDMSPYGAVMREAQRIITKLITKDQANG